MANAFFLLWVDNTLRVWNRDDGTTQYIYSSFREQWYAAEFTVNKVQEIAVTEPAWKMTNPAQDSDSWFQDVLKCFSYHSSSAAL